MKILELKIKDCRDCPYYEKIKTTRGNIYYCNNTDKNNMSSFRDLMDDCPLPNGDIDE